MITEDYHDREVSTMLARWRTEAGMTQVEMARAIGCSRSEIQQIEYNQCRVKSYTIILWAEITGHNPVHCMQNIIYPESSFSGSKRERNLARLSAVFQTFSDDQIEGLLEVYAKDHGGDLKAFIDLSVIYLRLSMGNRQNFTMLALHCYRLLLHKIRFRGYQPDLERLENAQRKGAEAHLDGKSKYKI